MQKTMTKIFGCKLAFGELTCKLALWVLNMYSSTHMLLIMYSLELRVWSRGDF